MRPVPLIFSDVQSDFRQLRKLMPKRFLVAFRKWTTSVSSGIRKHRDYFDALFHGNQWAFTFDMTGLINAFVLRFRPAFRVAMCASLFFAGLTGTRTHRSIFITQLPDIRTRFFNLRRNNFDIDQQSANDRRRPSYNQIFPDSQPTFEEWHQYLITRLHQSFFQTVNGSLKK